MTSRAIRLLSRDDAGGPPFLYLHYADPHGPYAAVIPRWFGALAAGEEPVLYGDGETSRDFCPVQNVVQANLLAACRGGDSGSAVYNVAIGGRTSLNQLFGLIRAALAARGVQCKDVEPRREPERAGDIRHSLADVSAAARDLGYAPSVGVSESLDELAAWFLASGG